MSEQPTDLVPDPLPPADDRPVPPPVPALAPTAPPARPPRVAALAAGRWFHRARVLSCELALSGRPAATLRLAAEVVPALIQAAGEMALSGSGWVELDLGPRLQSLIDSLGDVKHIELLCQEQQALDELTGYKRAVCDLNEYRSVLRGPVHEDFDRLREDFLVAVPESEENAFRLGEMIESGALPLAPGTVEQQDTNPSAVPLPVEHPAGFGGTALPDSECRPLLLAEPSAVPFERPWSPHWPGWVKTAWVTCGLPAGDAALPGSQCNPPGSEERRQLIETLLARARGRLEVLDLPTLTLADRFRIVDEGAQTVCLDGQLIVIEYRPAFSIVRALLQAEDNSMTPAEINRLPACRGDISKILKRLPIALADIVRSRPGPEAFYFLLLPPLQPGGD